MANNPVHTHLFTWEELGLSSAGMDKLMEEWAKYVLGDQVLTNDTHLAITPAPGDTRKPPYLHLRNPRGKIW